MKKEAIVIGSGISGLSISKMLQHTHNVKILERADKIGGLIKCSRVDGNLFHLVGGHVFNSRKQEVLDWFWSHFDRDTEFLKAVRNAKILFNNQIIGYPIENFIYQLPESQIKKIIDDLLKILVENKSNDQNNDFETFLKNSFGQTLYDLYFGPYNTKIWNTDLSKVPLDWLEGKLPMPKINDIILSNIIKKDEADMVHSTFYYPVIDGSQFIINRLAQDLDVKLSYQVNTIQNKNGRLSINEDEYLSDVVIYCGDIRQLFTIIKIEDQKLIESLLDVRDLQSNGTSNVLCETDDNDISWLYLPESKFKAHRIIYTGNFSETNNGTNKKTCVVEFSGKHDEDEMLDELKLLPGNLKAISFNYEPNSYIIHQNDTKIKIATLKEQLSKYNIYLLGRFSEWEYYNMDKCIEGAMQLKQLIENDV
ncbi:MAG: UDP-galactopyranose mutase [Mucilaginibacter sp.]|nr:UDP-galactopyranose mutase [Mucilaginibacter sp.]